MREGQPSATAMLVAFARGVATAHPELSRACRDPHAAALLPQPLARTLTTLGTTSASTLRHMTLGLVDHLALRTALIDEALEHAVGEGIQQLVLLGAGLDARAHRIASLRGVRVFEVDHPSTQAFKVKRARGLPQASAELRYAACDFERVSLPEALEQTGFDRTQKSAFIWEGVTMYLAAAALAATLADVARLSAPHSILMTTYVTHRLSARYAALGRAAVASLALVSEPMRSFMSPSEMASLQERHGFVLRSDVRPSDATDRFGIESHARFAAHPDERLVVTERRPH